MSKPTNIILQRLSLTPDQLETALIRFVDLFEAGDEDEDGSPLSTVDIFSAAVDSVYQEQLIATDFQEEVNQRTPIPTDPPTTVQGDPNPTPPAPAEPEPPTTVQGDTTTNPETGTAGGSTGTAESAGNVEGSSTGTGSTGGSTGGAA